MGGRCHYYNHCFTPLFVPLPLLSLRPPRPSSGQDIEALRLMLMTSLCTLMPSLDAQDYVEFLLPQLTMLVEVGPGGEI